MTTKELLLFYLKEQKGKWISGERISNRLSVTRSAVWKHIGKLREEGYIIESSPRKGYLFRKVSDLLLADEIRERLDTKVFGRRDIICLKETDSTNMKAKDSAAAGGAEGTV
ncbi:bifunctional biotin--[acetyl-CoA-carboxylase] synthetase/biotin operon repressor, partial [Candidatus Woesearchaeota archaeon]